MLTKKLGKNIFADIHIDLDEVDRFLDKYGLKIHWLFEDGVMFEYPPNIEPKYNYSGDCTFMDTNTGSPVLIYLENFDNLEFIDPKTDEPIFKIKLNE